MSDAPADVIHAVCDSLFQVACRTDAGAAHPTLQFELLDVYQALELWRIRIDHQLARLTGSNSRVGTPPQVKKVVQYIGDAKTIMADCEHPTVDVDDKLAELTCRTCGHKVSPVWWLSRHAEQVARAEGWRKAVRENRADLDKEIAALKNERNLLKQQIKRAKATGAKEYLKLDGSPELLPASRKKRSKKA